MGMTLLEYEGQIKQLFCKEEGSKEVMQYENVEAKIEESSSTGLEK